jgi:hypothetical protein
MLNAETRSRYGVGSDFVAWVCWHGCANTLRYHRDSMAMMNQDGGGSLAGMAPMGMFMGGQGGMAPSFDQTIGAGRPVTHHAALPRPQLAPGGLFT